MTVKLFHVVGLEGFHPHNIWEMRPDGLFELSGSVYAFRDEDVRECTSNNWGESCTCWATPEGKHVCPREGCTA